MGVTTVSNSLILGGWVTKVLKNGDKKLGGGRVGDNNILIWLFCPTVLDKKCYFLFIFIHICLFREVSFFTRRGAPENWGIRYFV